MSTKREDLAVTVPGAVADEQDSKGEPASAEAAARQGGSRRASEPGTLAGLLRDGAPIKQSDKGVGGAGGGEGGQAAGKGSRRRPGSRGGSSDGSNSSVGAAGVGKTSRRGLNTGHLDKPPPTVLEKMWLFLDEPTSGVWSYRFSIVMLGFIAVSTISFVMETVVSVKESLGADTFVVIEVICISGFTVEVVLRLVSTPSYRAFFTDFFNWIDLMAVLPFYIEQMLDTADGAGSFGVVRVIRLVRIARVIKVSRYSTSIRIFSMAMISSVRPLSMLFFLVSIAMVMFSSGAYYAEFTLDGCRARSKWYIPQDNSIPCNEENGWQRLSESTHTWLSPDGEAVECVCADPNPFTSIPATFWWCLVTMTTVGYGDEVPVTGMGKLVAIFTMVSGIVILALPITVIGTNFARVLREIQHEKMLAELGAIDKNDDGVVDKAELKNLLKTLASLAEGKKAKQLVPTDAQGLISKYDLDDNGVLDAYEMSKLKFDLAETVGAMHPAYKTLISSAEALRRIAEAELLEEEHVKADMREEALRVQTPRDSTPTAAAGAFPPVAYHVSSGGMFDDEVALSPTAAAAASGGAKVEAGSGDVDTLLSELEGAQPVAGSASRKKTSQDAILVTKAVQARVRSMEAHLDAKMAAVIQLLDKMNKAVTANASAEPLL